MDFDRRAILAAIGALAAAGCADAAENPPVNTRSWAAFRTGYLLPEGRIVDTGNDGISHSEGQGYGMVLAERAGDREAFDRMWAWAEINLARQDFALFSWRYVPGDDPPVADPNNATDGDLLIAWALMEASRRWADETYAERAAQIREAIWRNLAVERGGGLVLLPGLSGFDGEDRTTFNPSYYIWPALDAFREADPGRDWARLIAEGEELIAASAFGPLELPTDWVDLYPGGALTPAATRPPQFGFDAVRVPLYCMLGGRRELVSHIKEFWSAYLDQSVAIPAWVNVESGDAAPFEMSPGAMAVVRRLVRRERKEPAGQLTGDYYSDVLALLAALPASA